MKVFFPTSWAFALFGSWRFVSGGVRALLCQGEPKLTLWGFSAGLGEARSRLKLSWASPEANSEGF